MVFIIVLDLIGQFCRDVIVRQGLKAAVIGRLLPYCYFLPRRLLFVKMCRFRLRSCMSRLYNV